MDAEPPPARPVTHGGPVTTVGRATVSASGGATTRTVKLLTVEQVDSALGMQVAYTAPAPDRPPGPRGLGRRQQVGTILRTDLLPTPIGDPVLNRFARALFARSSRRRPASWCAGASARTS